MGSTPRSRSATPRGSHPGRLRGPDLSGEATLLEDRPNDAALALIETAWLNDVDPQAWLTQVLERIPDCKINCIDELLPWDTEPATEPEADA